MLRLIYRQRRRILFSSFLIAVGMMAMVLRMGLREMMSVEVAPWIVTLSIAITSLIVFILTAASIALLIILMPRFRTVWEQVGLLLVIHAAVIKALPWLSDYTIVSAFLPFFIIIAIGSVLYGPALDRFRLWIDHCETRRFRSKKSAKELWLELFPDSSRIKDHWDPLLYRMDPIAEEDGTFEVEYQMGHSLYEHQTMTFLEKDYPHHFRYHHQGEIDPKNRSLVEGTYDVTIEPEGDIGCLVTITHCRNALLPRVGLFAWFDDDLGSRIDYIRAKETGRRDWSLAGQARREILAIS